ncbi:DUF86 domain-containing protein [Candidatus Woesearchaeota archaeon]|nr:DUF86 domain-containing protein [Candidatus Woesearchaeota archaeon]
MNKKDDIVFIEHILDSIAAIEQFSKHMHDTSLHTDRLRRSAIVKEIEIIGEAAKSVSQHLKNNYPEVEWKKIMGTRDKLAHHYFGIDAAIVWDIVTKYLPILKEQVQNIKKELEMKES